MFDEETLFYGTRMVSFSRAAGHGGKHVRGTTIVFGNKPESLSQDAVEGTLVLPSVPATPATVLEDTDESGDHEEYDGLLRIPLIKTAEAGQGCESIVAVQSGRRSAVVRCSSDGRWLRLKGCGDLCAGFPLAPAPEPGKVQLRGCTFAATSARETAMSRMVASALDRAGLVAANTPLGWWVYPVDQTAPYAAVPRCCGLHLTRGDRRLLTHVLAGLDSLLALLPAPPPTITAAETTAMKCLLADPPVSPEIFTDYSSMSIDVGPGMALSLPAGVDGRWAPLWARLVAEMGTSLPLGAVYARLGYEAGRVLRLLHDARISWGTYRDALATHCNAHPNNLVLVLDGTHQQWLAPLDFDMAFSEQTYYGSDWSTMLALERGAMALSLAGDDQANSGASSAPVTLPESHVALQWNLRDTLVHHYLIAYDSATTTLPAPMTASSFGKSASALLKLALIISSNCVA